MVSIDADLLRVLEEGIRCVSLDVDPADDAGRTLSFEQANLRSRPNILAPGILVQRPVRITVASLFVVTRSLKNLQLPRALQKTIQQILRGLPRRPLARHGRNSNVNESDANGD